MQPKFPHPATVSQARCPHPAILTPPALRHPPANAESQGLSSSLQRAVLPKLTLRMVLNLNQHELTPAIVLGSDADPDPKKEIKDASYLEKELGIRVISKGVFENCGYDPSVERKNEPFGGELLKVFENAKEAKKLVMIFAGHGNIHWALAGRPHYEEDALNVLRSAIKQAEMTYKFTVDPILLSCCYGATEPLVNDKRFCESPARLLSKTLDNHTVFGFNGTLAVGSSKGGGYVSALAGPTMSLANNVVGFKNGKVTVPSKVQQATIAHSNQLLKNAKQNHQIDYYDNLIAGDSFLSDALNKKE
jgi:hypothetical protein